MALSRPMALPQPARWQRTDGCSRRRCFPRRVVARHATGRVPEGTTTQPRAQEAPQEPPRQPPKRLAPPQQPFSVASRGTSQTLHLNHHHGVTATRHKIQCANFGKSIALTERGEKG